MTTEPTTAEKPRKFIITRHKCQKEIDRRGNVCDRCGRKIVPMKTTDNARNPTYWAGCYHGGNDGWGTFTIGVTTDIYKMAVKMVCHGITLSHHDLMACKGGKEYLFQSHVSDCCNLLRNIEYLKNNKPRFTKRLFKSQL